MWHDSFISDMTHVCTTWFVYIWDDSFICDTTHLYVTRLIYMRQDSFICDTTHLYETWLIYIRHDSFTYDVTLSNATWRQQWWRKRRKRPPEILKSQLTAHFATSTGNKIGRVIGYLIFRGYFRKRAVKLVALLRKEICKFWHPMHLRHPVCIFTTLYGSDFRVFLMDIMEEEEEAEGLADILKSHRCNQLVQRKIGRTLIFESCVTRTQYIELTLLYMCDALAIYVSRTHHIEHIILCMCLWWVDFWEFVPEAARRLAALEAATQAHTQTHTRT